MDAVKQKTRMSRPRNPPITSGPQEGGKEAPPEESAPTAAAAAPELPVKN
jgi:hypothetical protein